MSVALRTLRLETARRLALETQRLAGPPPTSVLETVQAIGCLQLDPISVVARSHHLVLWSRLGAFDLGELDRCLWEERTLFEYWAHCASIVLTEDYPIHQVMMRAHPGESAWGEKTRAWIETNAELRDHILNALREHGALPSRYFQDKSADGWSSTGWTSGRNVSKMIDYLWLSGQIMVVGRSGLQKLWGLTAQHLPDWTPQEHLSAEDVTRTAAQKALRALGVARARDIQQYYIRNRYTDLPAMLKRLEHDNIIQPVHVTTEDGKLPGIWYIHTDTVAVLDAIEAGAWTPRTVVLSPFDNLIADRARTEVLFNFRFRIEIYVPQHKREYGYYVLPVLHNDRLIGRIDMALNRKERVLIARNVYAEADAPLTREVGKAVALALENLAVFLGAQRVDYPGQAPARWRLR